MHHSRISLPARRKSKAEKWPSCAAELWWRLGVSLMFIKGIWEWSGMYGNKCIYMCISIMCTYTYIHIYIYIRWEMNHFGKSTGTYWDIYFIIFSLPKQVEKRWAGQCRDRANDVTQFWARWFQPIPKLCLTPPVSQSVSHIPSVTGHISSNILGILDPLSYLFGYPRFIPKTTGKKHTHTCIYIYIYIYSL